MRKWLRRIRAAVAMGLTWAAAWGGAGVVVLLIVGIGAADVPFPLFFGLLGFVAGVTFSAVLGILGRRRRFDEMSLPRFAAWGAFGGFSVTAVGLLTSGPGLALLEAGAVCALAGAISAAGTLVLARKGEAPRLVDRGANPSRSLP